MMKSTLEGLSLVALMVCVALMFSCCSTDHEHQSISLIAPSGKVAPPTLPSEPMPYVYMPLPTDICCTLK